MYRRTLPKKVVLVFLALELTLLMYAAFQVTPTAAQGPPPTCNVSGTIISDTTWTPTCLYLVENYLTVAQGVTLTIQADTIIKVAPNKLIDIQGALKVQGTSGNPVYFTSLKDDTVGGDTNNDGILSQPAAGDWGHINFADTSDDAKSIIEHAIFRYGGLHQETKSNYTSG